MDASFKVKFEKPDLNEMKKNHTIVDLHFHTRYSDGTNTIQKIVEHARSLGIGIAITDHNEIRGALEIDQYKDILNIPGIEVTSKEGTHILVYFYDTDSLSRFFNHDIKPHMGSCVMSSTSLKMEEIISRARNYKTVIIFPHPRCAAYTGICNSYFSKDRQNRLFKDVDGVEVINSGNLKKWNLKGTILGFNLEKSMTGGSDGHMLKHMGKAVSYVEFKADRTSFLDAVKTGSSLVIGKEIDIFRKVTSSGLRFRNNIKNCPNLVEKNLRYSYSMINLKSKTLKSNVKRQFNKHLKNGYHSLLI